MNLTTEERTQIINTLSPLLGIDRSVLEGLTDEDLYRDYQINILE